MESAAKSCWFVVSRYDVPNANVSWIEAIVGVMVCADCSGLNNETCIQPRRRGCCSFKASKGLQPFSINCSQNPCHNSLYGAAFFLLVAMTTAALHHSSALVLGCIASPSPYSEMFRRASVNHSLRYTAPLFTYSFGSWL